MNKFNKKIQNNINIVKAVGTIVKVSVFDVDRLRTYRSSRSLLAVFTKVEDGLGKHELLTHNIYN